MSFWKKFFGTTESLNANAKVENSDESSADQEIEEFEDLNEDALLESQEDEPSQSEGQAEASDSIEVSQIGQLSELGDTNPESQAREITDSNVMQALQKSFIGTSVGAEKSEHENKPDSLESVDVASEKEEEVLSAEEKLAQELEEAEQESIKAELEAEREEVFEDLTHLDGRIIPQLTVPDWRQELEFVKERYEPCDLSEHIVKVSKRRLTSRQIEHELAQSRLNAYQRYLDRASRRFKDKIDEDALLNTAKIDISSWRNEQAKSVAWVLADRVNEEVLKAKQAEISATSFVENNAQFTNPQAISDYKHFARRMLLIPLTTVYIMSVVALTYSRFEWIMKFLPLFNLGLAKFQIMLAGVGSYFLLANFWRYSKKVAKIQRQLRDFNSKYQEQEKRIKHAVREYTRLSQQQPLLEPLLKVLARAYRVQLQSDELAKVKATTEFDTKTLPACVTLARADNTEESKMVRLKQRALSVLMTPGWRTRGLNDIAKVHAESKMMDSAYLSLSSLDTDSMVSASNAQRMLLEAFGNTAIHERVSKRRLVSAIEEIHEEVLANFNSEDRPRVISLRDNGFDKISFRTSWLADDDGSEEWIPFLTEILTDETSPFGLFNMNRKVRRSDLTDSSGIQSVAVVPKYFALPERKLRIEKPQTSEVMPLDIVVRVDVSPWAEPSDFAVFADAALNNSRTEVHESEQPQSPIGGITGA